MFVGRLPPTPWPEGQSMKPNEDNKTHVKFLKARDERHEANLVGNLIAVPGCL